MEKTIFGGKPNNPAAYCRFHHGTMTVKEIKRKGCLGKQCYYLRKNEEHEYWKQRALEKARKDKKNDF